MGYIHWYICTHTCQCIRLYACSEIRSDSIFFSFFLVSSNLSKSKLLTTRLFRYKEYQNQTYPYNYSPIPNRELCFSFLDSRSPIPFPSADLAPPRVQRSENPRNRNPGSHGYSLFSLNIFFLEFQDSDLELRRNFKQAQERHCLDRSALL